ncbi:cell division protein FtsQ/DivIB [Alkalibacillus almallahensis]|uniref:cell division protein FtsQ/DivIB n=1 Tax=Alkalibacillus almallahensis TaxID=1379154 RepID=UPI00141E4AB3|nr:FtsQ-type POTRA domain-containing protein [Alkalibacillus almallahensis]NIK10701.1 cell division protein FtsQ [Alkalibacillus almallahensis]
MADDQEKVVSLEERMPQLKHSRKRRANRRFYMVMILIILLILIIVYIQSPLSHVKSIETTGNSTLETEKIVELSSVQLDDSFWQLKLNEIKEQVEQHPEIEKVEISREWYNTVLISVSEYERVAYQQSGDYFYPILQNGERLERVELKLPREDAPLLHNFEGEFLQDVAKQMASMPDSISRLISEIYYEPNDQDQRRVRLFTIDGQEIIATIDQLADKMESYPSIAAQIQEESMEGVLHLDVGAYFVPYESSDDEERVEIDNGS